MPGLADPQPASVPVGCRRAARSELQGPAGGELEVAATAREGWDRPGAGAAYRFGVSATSTTAAA
jgi:hypothetical protein